mmetsp:Transcript_33074/g.78343  ORF Transcript_33074/g.78343 Transcript_33074/m.78343 type:complete len:316 (+) Transcript_33074:541-1488(+)
MPPRYAARRGHDGTRQLCGFVWDGRERVGARRQRHRRGDAPRRGLDRRLADHGAVLPRQRPKRGRPRRDGAVPPGDIPRRRDRDRRRPRGARDHARARDPRRRGRDPLGHHCGVQQRHHDGVHARVADLVVDGEGARYLPGFVHVQHLQARPPDQEHRLQAPRRGRLHVLLHGRVVSVSKPGARRRRAAAVWRAPRRYVLRHFAGGHGLRDQLQRGRRPHQGEDRQPGGASGLGAHLRESPRHCRLLLRGSPPLLAALQPGGAIRRGEGAARLPGVPRPDGYGPEQLRAHGSVSRRWERNDSGAKQDGAEDRGLE